VSFTAASGFDHAVISRSRERTACPNRIIKVLEDCFASVVEGRQLAVLVKTEKLDKLPEITAENVALPPHE
jgi:hypothetical protein